MRTTQELFAEVVQDLELYQRPHYMQISACAATLVASGVGPLSHLAPETVMMMAKQLGFELATHDDTRDVMALVTEFHARKMALDEAYRQAPFRTFEMLFFQDRSGQLMARLSMGKHVFERVVLDEDWEHTFVRAYHEAGVLALEMIEGEHGDPGEDQELRGDG